MARPFHKLTEANVEFVWTSECQSSFQTLKPLLSTAPVLAYPDFTAEFIFDTDASNHGIGAVLSQVKDGVEHPVAYASRTLTKAADKLLCYTEGATCSCQVREAVPPLFARAEVSHKN